MPAGTRRRRPQTVSEVEKWVNKHYGTGTLLRASDPSLRITRIPTGIASIDDVTGGGFARGRHVEVYGTYSVGKTYIALRLIAFAQAMGLRCAYIDAEHSFDPVFAKAIGVNNRTLIYHRQESGNRCIDMMEALVRDGVDVVVLDSIAALLPISERDNPLEAASMGTAQAKMMSAALRKITTANRSSVIYFVNQTREAVGVMFGNKTMTSGGKAMGFYAGLRLELVRTESIKLKGRKVDHKTQADKAADVVVGHRVLVRVAKDKTGGAHLFDETTFVFDYRMGGIDPVEDLIYLGRKYGVIARRDDRWIIRGYEDEAQNGRVRFKKWLRTMTAVQEDLQEMIASAKEGNAQAGDGEEG